MSRGSMTYTRFLGVLDEACTLKKEYPCLRYGQAIVNKLTDEELGQEPWPELFSCVEYTPSMTLLMDGLTIDYEN